MYSAAGSVESIAQRLTDAAGGGAAGMSDAPTSNVDSIAKKTVSSTRRGGNAAMGAAGKVAGAGHQIAGKIASTAKGSKKTTKR